MELRFLCSSVKGQTGQWIVHYLLPLLRCNSTRLFPQCRLFGFCGPLLLPLPIQVSYVLRKGRLIFQVLQILALRHAHSCYQSVIQCSTAHHTAVSRLQVSSDARTYGRFQGEESVHAGLV